MPSGDKSESLGLSGKHRHIRVFISSPSDVAEERDRARQVVEQLRRRYAGQFDLKAVLWEELPLQADLSFQQGIDLVLSQEQGIDIAIFILWSRLGSPTGALIRKPDGSIYLSGTEREFDLMLAARQENQRRDSQSDAPKILVYTRMDEASFDERLRGKPTDEKNTLLAQKKLVETFIQEEFHDAASGINIRAYHTFDQPVTFSKRLRLHLQEILDTLAGGFAGEPVWDIGKHGSPFRGLEAFEFGHNPVFFGREDEVLEVRRALQRKAREGCAFVLISGASGSGKSSLARAGVAPAVVEHEVDSAVSGWRYAVCAPSQFSGDLWGGLARLVCSDGVLPELRISADTLPVLAEGFATAPKLTVDQSLRPALGRASQGKAGATRLLLLVDQLEELFTDKRLTEADRNRFIEVLEALARSGVVWVLATVRSDFYQHCQRIPALMRMKQGLGQIDLLSPTADALCRLIEQPARLAGLSFEERDGKSLAGRILTDAAAHPELLPLVSYVLRELFEQRTPASMLTFTAYEQLGGVEGALAKRAERVFGNLPHAAQCELSPVLRALVSVSGEEEESVVRQHVPLTAFPAESPARMLVDRFVTERFLVTEKAADGSGAVAVAHEALLRVWSRTSRWIADNREFLHVRARVAARIKEGSRLLEGDPLLEAARHQLAAIPAGFTREQTAFIENCVRAVQQARQRRKRLRQGVVAVLAILLLVALGAAGWALKKQREAVQQRDKAQRTLSSSDFIQAAGLLDQGKVSEAMAYLVRSLSANPGNAAALTRLATLLTLHSWMLPSVSFQHGGPVPSAQFSPDGMRIVTASLDKTARVWDTQTGKPLTNPLQHEGPLWLARFSPNGRRIVTDAFDGKVRVWDAQTGRPVTPPLENGKGPMSVRFSPDGNWISAQSFFGGLDVWDAQTGRPSPIKPELLSEEFSPNGKRIAVISLGSWKDANGTNIYIPATNHTVLVLDLQTGRPVANPLNHEDTIASAHFSPDGKRIVTASQDKTARVWDAQTGQPLTEPLKHSDGVTSAEFSPDGRRILTLSGGSARVWEAQTGQPLTEPLKHSDGVTSAEISPDGKRVVTITHHGEVHIWNAETGQPVAQPLKSGPDLPRAEFNADGTCLLVSSGDDTVWVLDPQTGQALAEPITGAVMPQFSPDGRKILTGSMSGAACLWNVPPREPRAARLDCRGSVHSAQFSPDSKRILTLSGYSTACIWDAETGELITDPLSQFLELRSARFSPDGKQIVTASHDKTARVWDAQTGAAITKPLRHESPVTAAQFSPDGRGVVTVANNVQVWDVQTGKPLTRPFGDASESAEFSSAEFSPDGKRIVVASNYNLAGVYDAQTGKWLGDLSRDKENAFSARFSHDGKRILTTGANTTCIWDAQTFAPVTMIPTAGSAEFSPDDNWVLTASEKAARVWDAQTGRPVTQPVKQDVWVKAAHFTPDGNRIITVSSSRDPAHGPDDDACVSPDGRRVLVFSPEYTVRVWDARSGQPLTEPLSQDSTKGMGAPLLWDLPPSTSICPDWLPQLAQAVSGLTLSKQGVMEATPLDRIEILQRLRHRFEGGPDKNDWVVWGRWFLADRYTRTISPLSRITLRDYIRNLIRDLRPESVVEAESFFCPDPALQKGIIQARSVLEKESRASRLWQEGNLREAEAALREALALRRRLQGDKHNDVAGALHRLAWELSEHGKLAEAETAYRESLVINKMLGKNRAWDLSSSVRFLVDILARERKYNEAEEVLAEFLAQGDETELGHVDYLRIRGDARARRGLWKEAAADLSQALKLVRNEEQDPSQVERYSYCLAPLLLVAGQSQEYEKHRRAMLARHKSGTPQLTMACLLLPADGEELSTAAGLAKKGVTDNKDSPDYQAARPIFDSNMGFGGRNLVKLPISRGFNFPKVEM